MKTTIEIDDARLRRVMKLTGLKTRRAAVNRALAEMERRARIDQVLSRPWNLDAMARAMDPRYDVLKMRRMETASRGYPR
jgi:Arc/MetJ family transcription regulator